MERAVPVRHRAFVLVAYLVAILLLAEDCQCELPDPSGEDGWRVTRQVATSPVRL